MQKSNYILIMTVVVTLLLTVPLAFSMATVTVGGNSVTLEPGVEVNTNVTTGTVHVEPTVINVYPSYQFQYKEGDPNLVSNTPGNRQVSFSITIPKNTEFIIYANVYNSIAVLVTDINLSIKINNVDYEVHIEPDILERITGYYSAKNAVNNVMQKIEINDLDPVEHAMVCTDEDTVLEIDARRALNSATEIHFAIVYL